MVTVGRREKNKCFNYNHKIKITIIIEYSIYTVPY